MKTLRPLRRRIPPALIITLAALGASAQAQFSLTGATYTQNFDGLGTSGSDLTLLPGWFVGTGLGAISGTTVAVTTGSSNGQNNYNFGVAGTNPLTDRALGSLAAASAQRNTEFRFTNNTGMEITALNIVYDGEQWRIGGASSVNNQLDLQFSLDGVSFTSLGAPFTFDTPIDTAASGGLLDGNNPVNRVADIGGLYTLGAALTVGQTAYLRWADGDSTGTDSSVALDNLRLTATLVAGARQLLWSPITGAWDTTSLHWTENATAVAFANDTVVTFDDSGLSAGSTVTIQAAGVIVKSAKVTNTTGTYTFIGGALSGSGSLTKTGAGKLILNSPNAYTGATAVNEGTVSISADDQLGAATAPLSIGAAGTLEITASLTLNSSRPITGTGTVKIAPFTTLQIAGTANTGVITLSATGSLSFAGAASAQVGGFNIQDAANLAATLPILLNGPFTTTNTSGTVTVSAALNLGAATRIFNIADGSAATDITLGDLTSSTTGGRLHKLGDGTLEFFGNNSGLIGGVQLGTAGAAPVNGGTLNLNSALNLGPGGAGTAGQFRFNPGTIFSTSPLVFPDSLSVSFGSSAPLASIFAGADVEFLGASSFFSSGGVQHIIVANSNVRLAAPLTGTTTGLTIRGTGSLTLAAGGTFVSDVVVDSGKLIVLGNLGGPLTTDNRPAITVIANGILSGSVSGTDGLSNPLALGSLIAGDASTAGTIRPGTATDPTAILTAIGTISPVRDALAILTNGILAMDLGGTNLEDYDQIAAFGTVQLAGALNITVLNSFNPTVGDTFTLILNDDVEFVSGTFIGKAEGSEFTANGYFFRINYNAGDGNDVVLTTTVPEPGSAALLLAGLGLLGMRRCRAASSSARR